MHQEKTSVKNKQEDTQAKGGAKNDTQSLALAKVTVNDHERAEVKEFQESPDRHCELQPSWLCPTGEALQQVGTGRSEEIDEALG